MEGPHQRVASENKSVTVEEPANISLSPPDSLLIGQDHGPNDGLDWNEYLKETGETSTADRDEAAMKAMGRRQLLERNFGFISMVGFTTTMMANWEAEALSLSAGLLNGGNVALVYGFILSFCGTLATAYSLAELASMYPTAGGQYHFVALLAPPSLKNPLSWMAGWISILAWQATTASCAFIAATVTQGLLVLNYPDYVFERWHGTLMFVLIVIIAVLFNTALARSLPFIEGAILVLHFSGFFAVIIPLIMFGPQSTAEFVFTNFDSRGGWESNGVSWSIGLISSSYPFLCYDGACHMAEEVEDAAITVPRSMIATVLINGPMGFGVLLAILFSMGSIDKSLASPTGYAIIEIVYNATESKTATSAIVSIMVAMFIFATVGIMASSSRLTWAFARDKGLPLSGFFAKIHPKWKIPFNAVALTAVLNFVMSLLNVVSTAAFNAMISLAVIALYFTYITPILLILYLRLRHPSTITWGPFRVGKIGPFWMGPLVNVIAIVYTIYACIFLVFPPYAKTSAENMNWASLVCGTTILGAGIAWFSGGNKRYKGPLKEV